MYGTKNVLKLCCLPKRCILQITGSNQESTSSNICKEKTASEEVKNSQERGWGGEGVGVYV